MTSPPASAPADQTLVRLSQLARFWELHVRTLQLWIREGRLAAIRSPGNHFRVRVADVRAFCVRENMAIPPFIAPRTRRVVVAGASAATRRALARGLRAAVLEAAADPYEALVTAATAPTDLLALGAGGPRFDALAAVRAVKKHPATAAIAVVAFDVASRPLGRALERAGAVRALPAGWTAERLAAAIAELLAP